MDRDVAQLEQEHARRPDDPGLALRLARALARAGARARAFDLAQRLALGPGGAEAEALRDQLRDQPPWEDEPALEWLDLGGEEVLALALDAAEQRLAVGRVRGALEVVDLVAGGSVEIGAHRRSTSAVHFPPHPGWVVSGGGDGAVRLFDLADRRCLARLRGTASRCMRVRAWPTPEGPRLEGTWRGGRYRRDPGQPDPAAEDFPHPFLLTPQLEDAARAALDARVRARVEELFPDLRRPGGPFAFLRTPFAMPLAEDGRFLVLGSACSRFWALLVTGGVELHRVDAPPGADPDRLLEDPRLVLPRGLRENQPPAAALGPGGRALLVGGAAGDAEAPDHLVHLFSLTEPARAMAWDAGARVTAVALAPGGGLAAVATATGRVGLLRLLRQRDETTPVLRPAEVATPEAAPGQDLRETGPPPEDPGALVLLRRYPGRLFERAPRGCSLDAEALWVFQGMPPAAYARGRPVAERPAYRVIDRVDLGTGQVAVYPFLLHGDGRAYAYQLQRRWLVLADLRVRPAPDDAPVPALPGKASRSRTPGKKALAAALGIDPRDRWPAPAGPLVAVRARDRPQEVWVVHRGDPALHQHLELPGAVRHLAWSPGGTRLAVTLETREVWLYGTGP